MASLLAERRNTFYEPLSREFLSVSSQRLGHPVYPKPTEVTLSLLRLVLSLSLMHGLGLSKPPCCPSCARIYCIYLFHLFLKINSLMILMILLIFSPFSFKIYCLEKYPEIFPCVFNLSVMDLQ